MGGQNFILGYMKDCVGGTLRFSDCGPVWQVGIIAVLLVLAILALILLRWRGGPQLVQD